MFINLNDLSENDRKTIENILKNRLNKESNTINQTPTENPTLTPNQNQNQIHQFSNPIKIIPQINLAKINNNQIKELNSKSNNLFEDLDIVKVLKDLQNKGSKLKLEVINNDNLPIGTLLSISTIGLENTKRYVIDGYTYFGCVGNEMVKF